MKVAIIGAGNVGKALATAITRAGHEVTISASTPEHAQRAADAVGAQAAPSNAAATRDAEVVILAVPYVGAGEKVAHDIRESVAGKTVIDVTNPLKPDYSGLATENGSAAEEFQRQLPEASVVKAFNTIFASNQANPSRDIDGFVAGDDAKAKQRVISLIESIGFSPVDVGPLSAARHLEGMAYINIGLNAANGWDWTSAWRLRRQSGATRTATSSK
jgi:8-hydroxy-5-deazaflavin:NADPH oxidoreductase